MLRKQRTILHGKANGPCAKCIPNCLLDPHSRVHGFARFKRTHFEIHSKFLWWWCYQKAYLLFQDYSAKMCLNMCYIKLCETYVKPRLPQVQHCVQICVTFDVAALFSWYPSDVYHHRP